MNQLLERLEHSNSARPDDPAVIDGLIKQLESDLQTLRQAPPFDPELCAILGELITAQGELRDALKGSKSAVDHPDATPTGRPGSISGKVEESNRAVERFSRLSEKYLKSRGLVILNEPPKDIRLPDQARSPDGRHP